MVASIDLHILPKVDDEPACRRMAELLKVAGYSMIGLTIPSGLMREKTEFLKSIFKDAGIDVALRIDLVSPSRMELLRLLRRFRNSYDVVAVKCVGPRVANVACRDRRVDVVYFDHTSQRVRFSHPLANLLRGALEINLMSSLLTNTRGDVFSAVRKECSVAREHKVKLVLSSGSNHPNMIRSPSQLSALGRTLGLSDKQSFDGVGSTPFAIIHRNSIRRSPTFIEEGVRVVAPPAV